MPLPKYTLSCSIVSLSCNQYHFISHIFERLGFILELTNPYVVDFSVLSSVAGCLCYNVIRAGCMPISGFPLFKAPHVSASTDDYIVLKIVLHSVCIGPFHLGGG